MRAAGPVVDPVPCSGCHKLIDPLRAGHVAIFDQRYHFFCNRSTCRARFLGEEVGPEPLAPPIEEPVSKRADLDAPILPAFAPAPSDGDLPEPPALDDDRGLVEPIAQTILTEDPPPFDHAEPRDIGALLLVMAVVAGSLAVSLSLAGDAQLVIVARIILAAVGTGMLFGRAATTPRDACDPHPAPVLASTSIALGIAVWAAVGKDRALGAEAASLAGILVTAAAVSAWLVESARREMGAERHWIATALTVPGRRASSEGAEPEQGARGRGLASKSIPPGAPERGQVSSEAPLAGKGKVFDLRSGEQILVEPGEVVPVDVTITGGEVEVLPWIGATTPTRRRTGDAVVAGARVVRGRLRGVCTWAGSDRSYARVILDPRRRADALAQIAQASRHLAERWAIVAAAIGAVSAIIARRNPIEIALTALAVHAALSTAVIAAIASTHVARGILLALRRGIVYKSADAWDRAGRVGVAMFCARGTLLLGEPELCEVEAPLAPAEARPQPRTSSSPIRSSASPPAPSAPRSTPSPRPSSAPPAPAACAPTACATPTSTPASASPPSAPPAKSSASAAAP